MKRLLKYFMVLSGAVILSTAVSSCSSDGYSLDDFWISVVTVQDDGKSFLRDDGKSMWVASNSVQKDYKYERVLLNYTILGDDWAGYDYAIRLNSVPVEILTKDVIYADPENAEVQEELGDDPLDIESMTAMSGYMNIEFVALTENKGSHTLNLVSSKPDLGIENDVVELELRHNSTVQGKYKERGIVCFRLKDYTKPGRESVTFKVRVNTISSGSKTYDVVYKYKLDTTSDPK